MKTFDCVVFVGLWSLFVSSSIRISAFSPSQMHTTRIGRTTDYTRVSSVVLSTTPDNSDTEVDNEEVQAAKPEVKCPNCDLCDGSGRILGGLGAVIPWIPVKAYRPCPNFIDRGGSYQRSGQGLDEIAFGRERSD